MASEDLYAIADDPLDLPALIERVRTEACGAVVAFLGVVRAASGDGRPVEGLSYEAHPELALAELRAIGAEAERAFGGVRVAIAHRTGSLRIGEASVAVAVAAAHRGAAFDACEFAIDELKKRVPIWKKEHYTGGEARWRENAAPGA
ncbi:MAG: molybdenum cofactor biosynthesis protein MoaE [Candidatus Baltobacteraceae bacterium]|jgi:molybdopterin synthase catalytic subunit